ncbi:hypothetical protein Kpol_1062p47 [Vanderwaltozyma polyspora DSM 70294]|uniref:SWR1-complex protein 4 n=1 Tax=Vanderwaltozyma polyspora (strain ATCC 22028 / DSM 70294 / BCRC 21397 / CBS 2163 / NBRC 10782 / NRRL Y-8283 / UCD 57-17) TaxID=436907 RepID=A7TKA2_VANPO|nr:uncharacterized protein Kpol_1062p47 [Vanderwaltozyma polyspora DSM 70294]EDO17337.1 hypothetical protein Kpol_1062p47 [Vanderwaltozyma polyspora DSM 70294]
MASSDIFDVLNIQQKSKSPTERTSSPSPALMGKNASKPQVTGMQRELYNLLGENQPPIMVQANNRFKEKININVKPSPWTLAEFQATPTLKFKHWVKGSRELLGDDIPESSYTKYNKHLTIPSFTKEEYDVFMEPKTETTSIVVSANSVSNEEENKQDDGGEAKKVETSDLSDDTKDADAKIPVGTDDEKKPSETVEEVELKKNNNWEFEEVDYLFGLCKKYDMKWPVIHDRYTYNESRTIDDLKEEFYKVCQHYFRNKKADDPLLASLNFPKEKELERKKYLERLLARSAAEIAEEEALIIESRKFEMAAKKTLNERENLLRLLDSPNSNHSVGQFLTSHGISQLYNSLLSDKSRKRKHTTTVPENPWMKQQEQFAQQRQRLQQMHGNKQLLQQQQQQQQQELQQQLPPQSQQSQQLQQLQQLQNQILENSDSVSPRKTKKQKLEMQTAMKRKAESAYAEQLLQNFNKEEKNSLGVKAHGEKLLPGPYMRSTKISTFKPALQNKVNTTMQELGLPIRPAMLTSNVLEKHEELLQRIVTLTDLKKHLDKLEAEKAITK